MKGWRRLFFLLLHPIVACIGAIAGWHYAPVDSLPHESRAGWAAVGATSAVIVPWIAFIIGYILYAAVGVAITWVCDGFDEDRINTDVHEAGRGQLSEPVLSDHPDDEGS